MSSTPRPLAQRVQQIKPSPTLAITAQAGRLKAQGVDIVNFAAGEPDFDTPAHIQQAAIDAIKGGKTRYTPTEGIPQLLDAVIAKFKADNGLTYSREQIVTGVGAKNILYTLAEVLFDPKDEVVIPAPFWVSYPDQAKLSDARVMVIRTREADNFVLNPSILKKSVGKGTKAIVLNSPSNPTGAGYGRADLEAIAEIALEHNLWIISDEIYEKITFDGFEHISIASLSPAVAARTIVVNGMSKSYAMTGWRLGYAAGPAEVIRAMRIIQSQNISNPTSITQWAGLAALTGDQSCINQMNTAFAERMEYLMKRLSAIKGLWCLRPRGAFYAFPRIAHYFGMKHGDTEIKSSMDMAAYLLEQARVSAVPGGAFGADEYIRLSFATSMEQIKEGMDRIEKALAALTPGEHYENLQVHLEQKRF